MGKEGGTPGGSTKAKTPRGKSSGGSTIAKARQLNLTPRTLNKDKPETAEFDGDLLLSPHPSGIFELDAVLDISYHKAPS
jgi:hypothetical protein